MTLIRNLSTLFLAWNMLAAPYVQAVDSKTDTSKSYYKQEQQSTPIFISSDKLHWQTVASFPGAYCAVIYGDPSKEGPYTVRLKFPANYKVEPNWQTATIFVTVISGSYHIGVGDKFNSEQGKTLGRGSSVIIPSNSHLYFWTTEDVILQIHGLGPWDVHFVNPTKDPRKN